MAEWSEGMVAAVEEANLLKGERSAEVRAALAGLSLVGHRTLGIREVEGGGACGSPCVEPQEGQSLDSPNLGHPLACATVSLPFRFQFLLHRPGWQGSMNVGTATVHSIHPLLVLPAPYVWVGWLGALG